MEKTKAAEGGAKAPASIEDELRAIHDGLAAERPNEIFLLPGYREKLQVEYRVLSDEEADEVSERVTKQAQAGELEDENPMMLVLIDSLIQSCVQFLTQVDGEDVPLHVHCGEEHPIRWGDDRLKRIAGLEHMDSVTGRQILRGILTDSRLVADHARAVSRWAERALEEVRTDF